MEELDDLEPVRALTPEDAYGLLLARELDLFGQGFL